MIPRADSRARYKLIWIAGLPYPVRNTLRRWRGMVGMMVGVGIALGLAMTLVAVTRASMEYYTADFTRSGADLYVVTRGGTLVPVLPSDTPGTIQHAAGVLSQVRGLPEVNPALGLMSWPLAREREGQRHRDEPTELIATVGVDGDPTTIPDALLLEAGRWLRRSDEVVLGSRLSREKALAIGDSIRLNDRSFTVVGIGKLRGMGAGSSNALAYMDYRAFRQRAELGDVVSTIIIDTRLTFRPAQLSGGQRQRVAMARALANNPPLILADEPTGELHSEDKARVVQLLHEFHREGHTILVVTHDQAVAEAAERRLEMRDGRVRELT